jgi:hypothetical protein
MGEEKREYTVSFTVQLSDAEAHIVDTANLSLLAADAFAEFIANRCEGDAQAYVDERYPKGETLLDRDAKVQAVILRNQTARLFHGGVLRGVTVKLKEEE